MRVLPRIKLPKPKAARRLWRHSKSHISVRRVYYALEIALFVAICFLAFSGGRMRYIDTFGRRGDLIVSLILSGIFLAIHVVARRLLLPRIEIYYEPTPYDERKIFFDLGQGTQQVSTIEQLYQHLANRIRDAL